MKSAVFAGACCVLSWTASSLGQSPEPAPSPGVSSQTQAQPQAQPQPVLPPPPPGYVYVPQAQAQPQPVLPPPPPGYVYVPFTTAPAAQKPAAPQSATSQATSPMPVDNPPPLTEVEPRFEHRTWVLGVAPLLIGNVHILDRPANRHVSVEKVQGNDPLYPGFVGTDLSAGLMVDLRFYEWIGLELDVFYQHDQGRGYIIDKNRGSLCVLPGVGTATGGTEYEVKIGQNAWHLPILFKLSVPQGALETSRENDHARPSADRGQALRYGAPHGETQTTRKRYVPRGYTTFAFGPEWVFPEEATLRIDPTGLPQPKAATASNYLMYTSSLGAERRLARSIDLRLLGSFRFSFNLEPKDSVMRRATYAIEDGALSATHYKSEWRYQVAATLGLGWYFQ